MAKLEELYYELGIKMGDMSAFEDLQRRVDNLGNKLSINLDIQNIVEAGRAIEVLKGNATGASSAFSKLSSDFGYAMAQIHSDGAAIGAKFKEIIDDIKKNNNGTAKINIESNVEDLEENMTFLYDRIDEIKKKFAEDVRFKGVNKEQVESNIKILSDALDKFFSNIYKAKQKYADFVVSTGSLQGVDDDGFFRKTVADAGKLVSVIDQVEAVMKSFNPNKGEKGVGVTIIPKIKVDNLDLSELQDKLNSAGVALNLSNVTFADSAIEMLRQQFGMTKFELNNVGVGNIEKLQQIETVINSLRETLALSGEAFDKAGSEMLPKDLVANIDATLIAEQIKEAVSKIAFVLNHVDPNSPFYGEIQRRVGELTYVLNKVQLGDGVAESIRQSLGEIEIGVNTNPKGNANGDNSSIEYNNLLNRAMEIITKMTSGMSDARLPRKNEDAFNEFVEYAKKTRGSKESQLVPGAEMLERAFGVLRIATDNLSDSIEGLDITEFGDDNPIKSFLYRMKQMFQSIQDFNLNYADYVEFPKDKDLLSGTDFKWDDKNPNGEYSYNSIMREVFNDKGTYFRHLASGAEPLLGVDFSELDELVTLAKQIETLKSQSSSGSDVINETEVKTLNDVIGALTKIEEILGRISENGIGVNQEQLSGIADALQKVGEIDFSKMTANVDLSGLEKTDLSGVLNSLTEIAGTLERISAAIVTIDGSAVSKITDVYNQLSVLMGGTVKTTAPVSAFSVEELLKEKEVLTQLENELQQLVDDKEKYPEGSLNVVTDKDIENIREGLVLLEQIKKEGIGGLDIDGLDSLTAKIQSFIQGLESVKNNVQEHLDNSIISPGSEVWDNSTWSLMSADTFIDNLSKELSYLENGIKKYKSLINEAGFSESDAIERSGIDLNVLSASRNIVPILESKLDSIKKFAKEYKSIIDSIYEEEERNGTERHSVDSYSELVQSKADEVSAQKAKIASMSRGSVGQGGETIVDNSDLKTLNDILEALTKIENVLTAISQKEVSIPQNIVPSIDLSGFAGTDLSEVISALTTVANTLNKISNAIGVIDGSAQSVASNIVSDEDLAKIRQLEEEVSRLEEKKEKLSYSYSPLEKIKSLERGGYSGLFDDFGNEWRKAKGINDLGLEDAWSNMASYFDEDVHNFRIKIKDLKEFTTAEMSEVVNEDGTLDASHWLYKLIDKNKFRSTGDVKLNESVLKNAEWIATEGNGWEDAYWAANPEAETQMMRSLNLMEMIEGRVRGFDDTGSGSDDEFAQHYTELMESIEQDTSSTDAQREIDDTIEKLKTEIELRKKSNEETSKPIESSSQKTVLEMMSEAPKYIEDIKNAIAGIGKLEGLENIKTVFDSEQLQEFKVQLEGIQSILSGISEMFGKMGNSTAFVRGIVHLKNAITGSGTAQVPVEPVVAEEGTIDFDKDVASLSDVINKIGELKEGLAAISENIAKIVAVASSTGLMRGILQVRDAVAKAAAENPASITPQKDINTDIDFEGAETTEGRLMTIRDTLLEISRLLAEINARGSADFSGLTSAAESMNSAATAITDASTTINAALEKLSKAKLPKSGAGRGHDGSGIADILQQEMNRLIEADNRGEGGDLVEEKKTQVKEAMDTIAQLNQSFEDGTLAENDYIAKIKEIDNTLKALHESITKTMSAQKKMNEAQAKRDLIANAPVNYGSVDTIFEYQYQRAKRLQELLVAKASEYGSIPGVNLDELNNLVAEMERIKGLSATSGEGGVIPRFEEMSKFLRMPLEIDENGDKTNALLRERLDMIYQIVNLKKEELAQEKRQESATKASTNGYAKVNLHGEEIAGLAQLWGARQTITVGESTAQIDDTAALAKLEDAKKIIDEFNAMNEEQQKMAADTMSNRIDEQIREAEALRKQSEKIAKEQATNEDKLRKENNSRAERDEKEQYRRSESQRKEEKRDAEKESKEQAKAEKEAQEAIEKKNEAIAKTNNLLGALREKIQGTKEVWAANDVDGKGASAAPIKNDQAFSKLDEAMREVEKIEALSDDERVTRLEQEKGHIEAIYNNAVQARREAEKSATDAAAKTETERKEDRADEQRRVAAAAKKQADEEKRAAQAAKELADAQDRLKTVENSVEAAIDRVNKELEAMSGLTDEKGKPVDTSKQQGQLAALQKLQSELYKHQDKGLSADGMRMYQDALKNIIGLQQQVNRETENHSRLMQEVKSMVASYFSFSGAKRFVEEVIKVGGEFQKQKIALESILGDVSRANKLFGQMKSLSVDSPFTFLQLTSFTKQLSAFSIPYNELYDTTKRLADVSAGLGVDMGRIILAYGQVRSAAFLRGQELRQFTEAGIPLLDKLAAKFTALEGRVVSTGEVFKKISNREVSFGMVKDILWDMTNEGGQFFQMQENLIDTVSGKMAKLSDTYQIMLSNLAEANHGPLNWVLDMIISIVKNMGWLINTITRVVSGIVTYKAVVFAWGTVLGVCKSVTMGAAAATELLSTELSAVGKQGHATAKAIDGVVKSTKSITGAAPGIIGIGVALFGIVMQIVDSCKSLGSELDEIKKKANDEAAGEILTMNMLVDKINKATIGTLERKEAIDKLNEKFGEYLPNLVKESEVNDAIAESANRAAEAILRRKKIEANENSTTSIINSNSGDLEKYRNRAVEGIKNAIPNIDEKTAKSIVKRLTDMYEIGFTREQIEEYLKENYNKTLSQLTSQVTMISTNSVMNSHYTANGLQDWFDLYDKQKAQIEELFEEPDIPKARISEAIDFITRKYDAVAGTLKTNEQKLQNEVDKYREIVNMLGDESAFSFNEDRTDYTGGFGFKGTNKYLDEAKEELAKTVLQTQEFAKKAREIFTPVLSGDLTDAQRLLPENMQFLGDLPGDKIADQLGWLQEIAKKYQELEKSTDKLKEMKDGMEGTLLFSPESENRLIREEEEMRRILLLFDALGLKLEDFVKTKEKGNSKDPELDKLKKDFELYKQIYEEYNKYVDLIGEDEAWKKAKESKAFEFIFPDGTVPPETLDEFKQSVLALSDKAEGLWKKMRSSDDRRNLAAQIFNFKDAKIENNDLKRTVESELKVIQEQVEESGKKWDFLKTLLNAGVGKDMAFATAFGAEAAGYIEMGIASKSGELKTLLEQMLGDIPIESLFGKTRQELGDIEVNGFKIGEGASQIEWLLQQYKSALESEQQELQQAYLEGLKNVGDKYFEYQSKIVSYDLQITAAKKYGNKELADSIEKMKELVTIDEELKDSYQKREDLAKRWDIILSHTEGKTKDEIDALKRLRDKALSDADFDIWKNSGNVIGRIFDTNNKLQLSSLAKSLKRVRNIIDYKSSDAFDSSLFGGLSEEAVLEMQKNKDKMIELVNQLIDATESYWDQFGNDKAFGIAGGIGGGIEQLKNARKIQKKAEEERKRGNLDLSDSLEKAAQNARDKAFSNFAQIFTGVSGCMDLIVDKMKELAELSGDTGLIDAADKLKAVSSNFGAAGQGAASGGWIGAIVAGGTNMIEQTIEAIMNSKVQAESLKQSMKDFYNSIYLANLKLKDTDYSTVFGVNKIDRLQDAWSNATKALEKYNKLVNESTEPEYTSQARNLGATIYSGGISALGGSLKKEATNEYKTLMEAYKKGYTNLQAMAINTTHKSGWAKFWGAKDKYQSLYDLAPEIWDENGDLILENAKAFLETNNQISETQKKEIQNVIDLKEQYEELVDEIDSQLSEWFGSWGSGMTDAVFDAVLNGANAWDTFEKIGSESILNIGKTMMESTIFQSYFSNFQDQMREAWGSNNTGEELVKISAKMFEGLPAVMEKAEEFGESWVDFANSYGFDLSKASDSSSSTTSSIKGVSEETASIIASYMNSMRSDLSIQRMAVEEIRDVVVGNSLANEPAMVAGRGVFAEDTYEDYLIGIEAALAGQTPMIEAMAYEQLPLLNATATAQLNQLNQQTEYLRMIQDNTRINSELVQEIRNDLHGAVSGTKTISVG